MFRCLGSVLQKSLTGRFAYQQVRCLNLQEYHSKKLLSDNGVTVQRFRMASSADDVPQIVNDFKCREYVIKAQILAGGRGKGTFDNGFKGGVHLTRDPTQLLPLVSSMLGHKLTTKQTGADGVTVNQVMVAEALDIARETYLAILLDREFGGPVIVGSSRGGMDIEEVARTTPDAIHKEYIDIATGVTTDQTDRLADQLGFKNAQAMEAASQIKRLYNLFIKLDCTQVEINPFGETPDGQVVCFDAKLNFDDNAEFRQRKVFEMHDISESDKREVDAASHDLNYVGMDGNIGCLVNGAGLAMATMDIIKLHGGDPANFLDVGGSVTENQVYHAFRIVCSDPHVRCILVNIFGGIVDCAIIARGIVNGYKNLEQTLPFVVRLEGTNVEEARKILGSSGLPISTGDGLTHAAQLAVGSL